ncbi:PREDICTED: uncharacterized protein LOC108757167 [Trachymyrmex septentrionalis]|uniref:uncharacterized protein LOC108757167 n=1 Tax=Trachymyrmex septentrionalis TaxID=34720 RepID=UPI00084F4556|nr:PREDICTED: uncharacterized protein LOC108757167 [Trachymyrmex septentrionalis]
MSSQKAICVLEEKVSVFTWTKQATKLLQAHFARKEQFRDPKVRKKSIDTNMQHNVKSYNVDEDTLDIKMRNLKKIYRTIKDNNKKSIVVLGDATYIGNIMIFLKRYLEMMQL